MANITRERTGYLLRTLFEGLPRHHAQLDDTARRRLPLKPVWFLASED